LFEKTTILRFTGYFKKLLTSICSNIDETISHIDIIPEEEKKRILYDFNDTERTYPQNKTIHELFQQQVEKTPDHIALVGISKDEKPIALTYHRLNRESAKLAVMLKLKGIAQNSIAAVIVTRSIEMIVGIMGILKAGGAYLPIDPQYPQERINYMLNDSCARLLVTQSCFKEKLASHNEHIYLDNPDEFGELKEFGAFNELGELKELNTSGLAYIIYTSGTTGRPKGVVIEHHQAVNTLVCRREEYKLDTRVTALQLFSYAFDGFVASFFTPILSGSKVILVSDRELKDSAKIKEAIVNNAVTHFICVPPLYAVIIEMLTKEEAAAIKVVTLSGDKLPLNILKATSGKNKNMEIAHEYGVTEASVMSTLYRHQEKDKNIKIGKPTWNTKLYIVDKYDNPQPVGVPGQLCISGAGVARGYLNRPELTREKFVTVRYPNTQSFPNNQSPITDNQTGTHLYRTGDLARWLPDGNIEFLGRIDHQVKIRGFRIETREIEKQILKHLAVKEAVVITREGTKNDKYLCAYYVNDAPKEPELWPSVSEFFVYDELLYYAMTHDELRNDSYKVALKRLVKDKVVVEVGTGQDAILSRFCVEAGVKRVYTIEMLEESYNKAKKKIESLGFEDKIILIHGDATKVELPEKADVCLSEIVGSIGGSEGAAVIINSTWRFLKEDGVMIPVKSTTKIAAACLPSTIRENPGFTPIPGKYTEKIFHSLGYKFDLRLCVRNFPQSHVISNDDIFENLDFSTHVPEEADHQMNFVINKDARIDGFLIWLTLHTVEDEVIDTLENEYCWLPVFVPVFYPGIEVCEGDIIRATCTRTLADNKINPDFEIEGLLERKNGKDIPFKYGMPHFEKAYGDNLFYRELFKDGVINYIDETFNGPGTNELREYLASALPEYMLPTYFVQMEKMPLTPNGKIDRKALPEPAPFKTGMDYTAPRNHNEIVLTEIWQEILETGKIGIDDDFFAHGGDSIKAIQIISRLKKYKLTTDVTELFLYKTIRQLAKHLKTAGKDRTIHQGLIMGDVSLTPVQQWFIKNHLPGMEHFNQSVMLFSKTGFNETFLEKTFTKIVTHHDALRMVYEFDNQT
ncbi:MAG: amino acid adenylation domain-containing protein, partial [bacterium]|nr:amino acid adenylation domain-containing protein [bacterium]